MSMSSKTGGGHDRYNDIIQTPTAERQTIPLDPCAQTPKNNNNTNNGTNSNNNNNNGGNGNGNNINNGQLKPFANLQFDQTQITPMGDTQIGFPFPLSNNNNNNNDNNNPVKPQLNNRNSDNSTNSSHSGHSINNKNDDNKSEMSSSTFGNHRSQNKNSVAPSVMSVCSSNNDNSINSTNQQHHKYKSQLPSINQISRGYQPLASLTIPNNNNNNYEQNENENRNNNRNGNSILVTNTTNIDTQQQTVALFEDNSFAQSMGSSNSIWSANGHRISDASIPISTPSSTKFGFSKDPNKMI